MSEAAAEAMKQIGENVRKVARYSGSDAPAREGGSISKQFINLSSAISDLEEALSVHRERIDAVLKPDYDGGVKAGGDVPEDVRQVSDLADRLDNLVARVGQITYRVRATTSLIDL